MKQLLKSFGYAARGVWYCVRYERNFRIHLTAIAYVVTAALYFSLTRAEWAALVLVFGLVPAAEAGNTAIEKAVDLASPDWQVRARVAKDVAAGAVLLCALTAVVLGVVLFARPEGWAALAADFRAHLWKPLLAGLSVPLALWFVFGWHGKTDK